MGNNVVIPSLGNWYIDPLRRMKIKVKSTIESSTFFLTLDCVDENDEPLIVKAYEYTKSLYQYPIVQYSIRYFTQLSEKADQFDSLCSFYPIKIIDKCAFLVRPKYEYTLSQRLSDYPLPEEIEKRWISHQFLSAVASFHEMDIVHGNIHPDNVFLSWDLRLTIGDPAPYKPPQIHFNQPQTFIHFFGSSNTHCYLSPRRLIINEDDFIIQDFQYLDASDDIFSCGCVIYFIFTQKHLFSLTTLGEYIDNKFDVEEPLREIPDDLRDLVRQFISLDPKVRISGFRKFHTFFPLYFTQFFYQIEEFFHNQIQLNNLIHMIPTFDEFAKIGGNDVRIILSNILAQFLLKSDDLHAKVNFSYFFIEYFTPLPDELLLTRVLPNIVGLLDNDSTLMTRTVFNCLEVLFDSVKQMPRYLSLIFQNYLVSTISNLAKKATSDIRCAICEFVPKLIKIIGRLDPSSASSCIKIVTFIMKEDDEKVLNVFVESFKSLAGDHSITFNTIYPLLFSCLNSPNEIFKAKIFDIFRSYYPHLSPIEKNGYRKLVKGLLAAALNLGTGESLPLVLEFLDWLISVRAIEKSYFYDIYNFVIPHLNSTDPSVRYLVSQISSKLPDEFSQACLPVFVLKSLNSRTSHHINASGIFEPPEPSENCVSLLNPLPMKIRTKFIATQQISNDGITSIAPIYHIDNINNNDSDGKIYQAIAADRSGSVYQISFSNNSYEKLLDLSRGVSSMLTYESSNTTIFGTNTNIALYEWNSMKLSLYPFETKAPIQLMNHIFNENCFYCIGNDSSITFFDRRAQKSLHYMKFNDFSLISTCIWPESRTVAFGFAEGEVTLLDPRLFLPFKTFQTVPAKCICPIYEENGGFFVGGNQGSEVFNFTQTKPFMTTRFQAQAALSYKGSAVFVCNDATVLLKTHPYSHAYVLNDCYIQELKINKNDPSKFIIENEYCGKPPLHNHSVPIKSVTEIPSGFVSGDVNGNVSLWSFEK
ncbi:CAMK family protein kinase [Tritrichomonas foetus]|uniref:non-specific serine/threonine protein kinase n=1 Tax=Tritrichomonas foetus TaxID=1144522 RepID=A0A1J4KEN7_9EUKA|nr:CAMK family protein kinase [Tritrichomonas foetus]|eukprot:OHT08062.1 CAMK family protein kinase [Tritrichomonas foetus]